MAALISSARARRMYTGRQAGPAARRFARAWVWLIRNGLVPARWVVLEVPGRTSGRPTRIPLGMVDLDGDWYLVSMLGECHWTKNVRAAGGAATLVRRSRRPVRLVEVPDPDPRILQRYLAIAPGGRPHVRVDKDAPLERIADVAGEHPVFRVEG